MGGAPCVVILAIAAVVDLRDIDSSSGNTVSTARAVNILKPHWVSSIPGTASRWTSRLKTRPVTWRNSGSPTRRAPAPSRLPIATSAVPRAGGMNRSSSCTGMDRSASQMNRCAAFDASSPARTAPPWPRCGSRWTRTRPSVRAAPSTARTVPSVDPSSTTTTSHRQAREERYARSSSSVATIRPSSLKAGTTIVRSREAAEIARRRVFACHRTRYSRD